jgi:mannose-1-phosphate guanylyltransferase
MARPKQFLSISASGESLIQATARRVLPLVGKESVVIATNDLHVDLIREHVPYSQIITEPLKRNTAASIGLSAAILAKEDPETVMVVLPADHAVEDEENLRKSLQAAIDVARENALLVTIGIVPTSPNTAYGYIRRGEGLQDRAFAVERFYEKPSLGRAEKYLEDGNYFWNSGMFAWRASVFLDAVKEFMPELHEGLMEISDAVGSDEEAEVVHQVFERLPSISVDFGILEHARNCAVVEAFPYGWNDVGSWDAWAEHFQPDAEGNLIHGDAMALESRDCVISSEDRMIAVLGVENLIVIDSGDALLICPRDRVQEVRKIVKKLKEDGRTELI